MKSAESIARRPDADAAHAPEAEHGGVLADAMAWAAYAFLKVLIRIAPERPLRKRIVSDNAALPENHDRHPRSVRFVWRFVSAYRRSALYAQKHKHGSPCRFIPSCTDYSLRAVAKYGLWRGLWMAGGRFRRCTPSYDGDYLDFP